MNFSPLAIRTVFNVALALFAVLTVFELFLPGFATSVLSLPLLAVALLLLGFATAFHPPARIPPLHGSYRLLVALTAVLTFPVVWLTLAPFGALAFVAASAAALVAGFSAFLLTSKH